MCKLNEEIIMLNLNNSSFMRESLDLDVLPVTRKMLYDDICTKILNSTKSYTYFNAELPVTLESDYAITMFDNEDSNENNLDIVSSDIMDSCKNLYKLLYKFLQPSKQ